MDHPDQRTLLFSFDTLEAASQAREAMLEHGYAPGDVQVSAVEDEAGPVQGNWVAGNGIAMDGSASSGVIAGSEIPYHANFERVVTRGTCLLRVRAKNGPSERLAVEAAARHGGVDVLARTARSGDSGSDADESRQGDAVPARARRD